MLPVMQGYPVPGPVDFGGFADPTALVGLTAINGVAATAMRSDAAPALNQAITPTWTGLHTFSAGIRANDGSAAAPAYSFTGATDAGMNRAGFTLEFSVLGVARAYINSNGFAAASFGSVSAPPFSFLSATTSGMYLVAVGQLGFAVSSVQAAVLTSGGQWQLPVVGSGAGIRLGGDVDLYRSAANEMTIPGDKIFMSVTASNAIRIGQNVAASNSQAGSLEIIEGGVDGVVVEENGPAGFVTYTHGNWAPRFRGNSTGGTRASPTATGLDYLLIELAGGGHSGSGYITAAARLNAVAAEAFTTTTFGSNWEFRATPIGSATLTLVATLTGAGQLQLPITGSGGGTLWGGDFQIYRAGPDLGRTPDSFTVDTGLNVGTASGAAAGQIRASAQVGISLSFGVARFQGDSPYVHVHIRPNSGSRGAISFTEDGVADRWVIASENGDAALYFATGGISAYTKRGLMDGSGNFVWNTAALATTATDGFLYITTSAGAPTGTPTAYTGRVVIHYDTTNNRLYIYSGGWKSVALT